MTRASDIMHVIELRLSPAALACLRAADIYFIDELITEPADDLIEHGVGPNELYEVVCRLAEHDLCLPPCRGGRKLRPPKERDLEVFRLRVVEGMTLIEVGERTGLSRARVRQLARLSFGLGGVVPTVKARRWAATEARRRQQEGTSTLRFSRTAA
ncbi:MAG: sigma factor-like helix-turn-helix DNA-binding protein [Solirubrobacteraceae bacterium]